MGIENIYNFLKKNPGFHSSKDIREALGLGQKGVDWSLKALSTYSDIICEYRFSIAKKGSKTGIRKKKAWHYKYKRGKC